MSDHPFEQLLGKALGSLATLLLVGVGMVAALVLVLIGALKLVGVEHPTTTLFLVGSALTVLSFVCLLVLMKIGPRNGLLQAIASGVTWILGSAFLVAVVSGVVWIFLNIPL